MRMLTWGIVALFGFAGLAAMSVHGSKDERSAIRLAVRAPFADVRQRDARRLCEDFTPAVDARLAPGSGGCDARVGRTFRITHGAAVNLQTSELASSGTLRVTRISWSGDRATAVSSYPGNPGSERRWRLQRIDHVWRIATPARLGVRADCRRRISEVQTCAYAMAVRF
jgi:hypothetical protein